MTGSSSTRPWSPSIASPVTTATASGGSLAERNAHFTGTRPGLGNQGRLPPPLSHVGAKLKPSWIAEVLLRGKRQRDYLDASMPQYGEANVGHLVDLFGKVDELEAVTIPKIANIRESKNAGYEMMGTTGFSCIACHDFNGQKAGGAGALDIVHVTERIREELVPPLHAGAIALPYHGDHAFSYWPGGQSIRPNILKRRLRATDRGPVDLPAGRHAGKETAGVVPAVERTPG